MKPMQFNQQKNIISGRLSQAREQNHLSQQDLAARMQLLGADLDQQTISRIELGKRIVTDYELKCFCLALRVDEKWMLADFEGETG